MKEVFEGRIVDIDKEDGGQALICHMEDGRADEPMFVRIQSWDPTREHPKVKNLKGALVRVTVEVLEYAPVPGDRPLG